jgi:hypothetical protein
MEIGQHLKSFASPSIYEIKRAKMTGIKEEKRFRRLRRPKSTPITDISKGVQSQEKNIGQVKGVYRI